MNCKKYRACLVCLVVAVVVCGAIFLVMKGKKSEVPVDGTLVNNCEEAEKEQGVNGFKAYGEETLVKNCETDEAVPQFEDEADIWA
ncbi:MAG: hypothetical protein J6C37_12845 [Roseburia sp.]|nr:hypothetical protein [Roseburia sp.]